MSKYQTHNMLEMGHHWLKKDIAESNKDLQTFSAFVSLSSALPLSPECVFVDRRSPDVDWLPLREVFSRGRLWGLDLLSSQTRMNSSSKSVPDEGE